MQSDPMLDVNLTRALQESTALADSIKPGSDRWDVIVVGSGAAGGMAAFQLVTAGVKVLMLEAGRMIDTKTEYRTMEWPYASMRRNRLESDVREVAEGLFVRGEPLHAELGGRRAAASDNGYSVRVGPIARARRQDELLGPRRAALRAAAVQRREPRRVRRRLADLVRRREAVLRQGRRAARLLGHH